MLVANMICCLRWTRNVLGTKSTSKRYLNGSVVNLVTTSSGPPPTTLSEHKQRQNRLFEEEKKRQSSLIPRVEKIKVTVQGIKTHSKDTVLLMNKDISTPYDCALHIHEMYTKQPIALIDGKTLWDFHRPLEKDCTLSFQNFLQEDPRLLNKVFWKSCSFVLGLVVETAFKTDQEVTLHSWPNHPPSSGSFIYDVHLPKLKDWTPKQNETLALTSVFWKIKEKGMKFERLSVPKSVAENMFSNNQFKLKQLQGMDRERVTLYRIGDHIDISVGPMVSNTNQIGRGMIVAVHPVNSTDGVPLYRFQGLAIPESLRLNHFPWNILVEKAKVLNSAPCV